VWDVNETVTFKHSLSRHIPGMFAHLKRSLANLSFVIIFKLVTGCLK